MTRVFRLPVIAQVRRSASFVVEHYLALPLGALAALLWANLRPESYFTFAHDLSFGVNNVGMALVFALITKEVVDATRPGGALHTWRRVMLAVVAAGGGIAGAVVCYFWYLRLGDESVLSRGWPILCATDIAFSYFIARAICRRAAIPFLLLVAIVSNAVGLVILELRYPIADVHSEAIVLVITAVAIAIVLRACDVATYWPYLLTSGPLSWFGLFWSGLHPALALVPIVPFLTYSARARGFLVDPGPGARDALSRFERAWRYPAHAGLLLFGLVNAGVVMRGVGTGTWAVLVASLAGKPSGMLIALVVAVAAGLRLPHNVGWRDMVVVAFASSIGFTFALFFATTAFPVGPLLTQAKIGALMTIGASLLAIAAAWLLGVGRFSKSAKRRRTIRLPEQRETNDVGDRPAVAV